MISGWFDFQDVYRLSLNFYKTGKFVEVGSWLGKSSQYLASLIKNSGTSIKLYCVDTWEGSKNEPEHAAAIEKMGGPAALYNSFLLNLSEFIRGEILVPIKKTSIEAAEDFEDNSLDFVYIDAGHTYEEVKQDLLAWLPKVRSGGLFAGHDYDIHNVNSEGLIRAVQEILTVEKLTILNKSWCYIKD